MAEVPSRRIDRHAMGMITLLIIQYILGMAANIYVQFPKGGSVSQNWEFMHGQWLIWAHLTVGTLLVFGVVALTIRAIKLNDNVWKIAGGIATGSVVLAWICGEEFISRQTDTLSFAMSFFFMTALISLGWGLYQARVKLMS